MSTPRPYRPFRTAYLLYRMRRRRKSKRSIRFRVGDVARFFADLERGGVPYVVMRWFDEVPLSSDAVRSFRGDVDILIGDDHERLVARAAAGNRGSVAIELRSVHGRLGSYAGMPYYPPTLAEAMLSGRVRHARGFFVPGPADQLPSLLFHLCYHKAEASGIPTGEADVPGGVGKRDYAALLEAVARRSGDSLPRPLTLRTIHAELERSGWAMQLDLLTRWPARSGWIAHLTRRARARHAAAARALPSLAVFILREDLPPALHGHVLDSLGRRLDVVEFGALSADQRDRVRRHVRGGSWHVRAGAPPAGPTHYVLCQRRQVASAAPADEAPHVAIKRRLRARLRSGAAGSATDCRHGLHGSDDAGEAHHMLTTIFGPQAAAKRAELAGLPRPDPLERMRAG